MYELFEASLGYYRGAVLKEISATACEQTVADLAFPVEISCL